MADSEVGSVGCFDRPHSGAAGNVKQLLAVSGMSVGCLLDGIVIAYSSPAIPSLLAKVKLPSLRPRLMMRTSGQIFPYFDFVVVRPV